jgi:hypothetical protein
VITPAGWEKAPRTPWWRRLRACWTSLRERLDLRERRIEFGHRYPCSTWAQRREAAALACAEKDSDAMGSLLCSLELEVLLRKMGPAAKPHRPLPRLSLTRFERSLASPAGRTLA